MRTIEQIKSAVLTKGYKWFEKGDYNLNLIFVREDDFSNKYTDTAYIVYKVAGEWVLKQFRCSVDAGDYYIFKTMITYLGVKGTAVKKEGQNVGAYTFIDNNNNTHKSPHLKQTKAITIYRDGIANRVLNRDKEQTSKDFGTNIHRATGTSIWNWSAGCTVIPEPDYTVYFDVIRRSARRYGNVFTETILNKTDFL